MTNHPLQVKYSPTKFSGTVAVGDSLNNFTYAEVVPTTLRVHPTYTKVSSWENRIK